jgi:hypothetical protein
MCPEKGGCIVGRSIIIAGGSSLGGCIVGLRDGNRGGQRLTASVTMAIWPQTAAGWEEL